MNAYYCDRFELPLPGGHRFPMAKYRLLRERVAANAAAYGIELREPPRASDADLLRVHSRAYVEKVRDGGLSDAEQRRIGFPWSPAMNERSRHVSGATMAALTDAIGGQRIAVNLAGGTHHASFDAGAGYCVFNDSVVAARHAQHRGLARRILIVDLDVHHGNGTASLCAEDPSIFCFSMHGARNYPAVKPAGDLDIALEDGIGDNEYLAILERNLAFAIHRARADAIIYLAGADPYEHDRLGRLKLSKQGLLQRDEMVLDFARRHRLPVAISMAGGYAPNVDDIVDIHWATVSAAARAAARQPADD